jgi:hypothetical protein
MAFACAIMGIMQTPKYSANLGALTSKVPSAAEIGLAPAQAVKPDTPLPKAIQQLVSHKILAGSWNPMGSDFPL